MDILKLMLLCESAERNMAQQEPELPDWHSGKCLTTMRFHRDLQLLSQLPLQREKQLWSFPSLALENCPMPCCHQTALHLCSVQKASDASVLLVGELRKIIYVHKQQQRTFLKITPNTPKFAISRHVISTDLEWQRGTCLLEDLFSFLPSNGV